MTELTTIIRDTRRAKRRLPVTVPGFSKKDQIFWVLASRWRTRETALVTSDPRSPSCAGACGVVSHLMELALNSNDLDFCITTAPRAPSLAYIFTTAWRTLSLGLNSRSNWSEIGGITSAFWQTEASRTSESSGSGRWNDRPLSEIGGVTSACWQTEASRMSESSDSGSWNERRLSLASTWGSTHHEESKCGGCGTCGDGRFRGRFSGLGTGRDGEDGEAAAPGPPDCRPKEKRREDVSSRQRAT
mmetsp:Transcript_130841/g.418706  ORF Transcript_130841/g.418706 Transcript_130841/m.418706 type:complete len:245 (+) Transcript_130841:1170-1904(+)